MEIKRSSYYFYVDRSENNLQLSPNCIDGFLSCTFQGLVRNCSDIFVIRKTQDGFCCTFNYVRESDDLST